MQRFILCFLFLLVPAVHATPPVDVDLLTAYQYGTATTQSGQRECFQSFKQQLRTLEKLRLKLADDARHVTHGDTRAVADWMLCDQLKRCQYALSGYLFASIKGPVRPPDSDLEALLVATQICAELMDDPEPLLAGFNAPPITGENNARLSALYCLGASGSVLMQIGHQRQDEGLILLGLEYLEQARAQLSIGYVSSLPVSFQWSDPATTRDANVKIFLDQFESHFKPYPTYYPVAGKPKVIWKWRELGIGALLLLCSALGLSVLIRKLRTPRASVSSR